MWILVLRNAETGRSHIWRSERLDGVVRKVALFHQVRTRNKWSEAADCYILENYEAYKKLYSWDTKSPGVNAMVKEVGRLLRRCVSKRAIIGRHHRLVRKTTP